MNNNTINSKPYWEHRFNSGNWGRNGQLQTEEYAKANVENLNINKDFTGSILDFGCAQGDAIPIYLKAFPNAKIFGIDISESAIAKCNKKFGNIAEFYSGDTTKITYKDIVIASHVMEHIPKDKNIVKNLLTKCTDLFVFVPYKEEPLYFEHVNYYDENYYNELNVYSTKIFNVSYKIRLSFKSLIRNLLYFKFFLYNKFSKNIIMFHIKGASID